MTRKKSKRKRQSNNELKRYFEERFAKQDERITKQDERIAKQDERITKQDERIADLATDLPVTRVTSKLQRQSNNELKRYFEERFAKQDEKITKLSEQIAKQDERMSKLSEQIADLATDLKSLRRDTRAVSYCQMRDTYWNIIQCSSSPSLRESARRYSTMLLDHKRKGDVLDSQETKFLDVMFTNLY